MDAIIARNADTKILAPAKFSRRLFLVGNCRRRRRLSSSFETVDGSMMFSSEVQTIGFLDPPKWEFQNSKLCMCYEHCSSTYFFSFLFVFVDW
jgi:hypothetical protein